MPVLYRKCLHLFLLILVNYINFTHDIHNLINDSIVFIFTYKCVYIINAILFINLCMVCFHFTRKNKLFGIHIIFF